MRSIEIHINSEDGAYALLLEIWKSEPRTMAAIVSDAIYLYAQKYYPSLLGLTEEN